jgi:hypothetical protein
MSLSRAGAWARWLFIFGSLTGLLLLRWFDPQVLAAWLPVHTSCGAVTGLPCVFCGMTRALHLLLNGNLARAFYFNWLVFPFLGAVLFLVFLFLLELRWHRKFCNWRIRMTALRLTLLAGGVIALWILQASLAVAQHKQELLNPQGLLYSYFVRSH